MRDAEAQIPLLDDRARPDPGIHVIVPLNAADATTTRGDEIDVLRWWLELLTINGSRTISSAEDGKSPGVSQRWLDDQTIAILRLCIAVDSNPGQRDFLPWRIPGLNGFSIPTTACAVRI